ncbi:MAG TPA: hypothetical protein VFA85_05640 [Terriglobales bacterium]|nr:hypothetical protein [Terriglobales bacterium]
MGPLSLRDLAAVFFRHQRLLGFSFATVLIAGTLYPLVFPSYKAEMEILVRRGRIDPVVTPTPSPSPAFEHDEITEEELNSEVELLRDGDILRQVVLATNLERATWFSKLLRQSAEQRTERAVRRLAQKLEVVPVRKSRLITVSYACAHPALSAAILKSLAAAYIARHAELRRPAGEQLFFEQQVDESRGALEQAQANLIAFTRRAGVVSAELQRDLVLHRLSETEAQEGELESARAEESTRAESLDQKLRELPERRVMQIKNADNPELEEKLKSKLLELQLRRTELLTKFQPSYRLVQELDEQIAQAKSAIASEDEKPLRDETTEANPEYEWAHSERLKTQVELNSLREKQAITLRQISEYRAIAERLEESSVVQHDLEQKLKTAEEKWLLYSNKREEARIGDALDHNGLLNVAISEPPRTPALPSWSLLAACCVAFFGACRFSTAAVFAADYLDPSFRTPREVFQILGSPVLASLPARTNSHGILEAL